MGYFPFNKNVLKVYCRDIGTINQNFDNLHFRVFIKNTEKFFDFTHVLLSKTLNICASDCVSMNLVILSGFLCEYVQS